MDLNFIFLIISVSISVLGIVYSILSTLLYGKKKTSVKLAKILQALPELIKDAEGIFTAESCGASKLAYVLNQVHVMCLENHLEFNPSDWAVEIEGILATPQSHSLNSNVEVVGYVDTKVTK